jgi:hypothetical protein
MRVFVNKQHIPPSHFSTALFIDSKKLLIWENKKVVLESGKI